MAILSEVPGLAVTIDVGGQDTPEYDYDGDEESEATRPNTSTKYIEAQSGAQFGMYNQACIRS